MPERQAGNRYCILKSEVKNLKSEILIVGAPGIARSCDRVKTLASFVWSGWEPRYPTGSPLRSENFCRGTGN